MTEMFAVKQSSILPRLKREAQLIEAVLNVTTACDRLLMDLRAHHFGVNSLVDGFYSEIYKIRNEFTRLRRKKGKISA